MNRQQIYTVAASAFELKKIQIKNRRSVYDMDNWPWGFKVWILFHVCMYVWRVRTHHHWIANLPTTYYVLLKPTRESLQDHGKCVRFFLYFLLEPRPSACASPIHHPGLLGYIAWALLLRNPHPGFVIHVLTYFTYTSTCIFSLIPWRSPNGLEVRNLVFFVFLSAVITFTVY